MPGWAGCAKRKSPVWSNHQEAGKDDFQSAPNTTWFYLTVFHTPNQYVRAEKSINAQNFVNHCAKGRECRGKSLLHVRASAGSQGAYSEGKATCGGSVPFPNITKLQSNPSSRGGVTEKPQWHLLQVISVGNCTTLKILRYARLVTFFGQAPSPLRLPLVYLISQAIWVFHLRFRVCFLLIKKKSFVFSCILSFLRNEVVEAVLCYLHIFWQKNKKLSRGVLLTYKLKQKKKRFCFWS